jgi:hypothetical protein
MPVKEFDSRKGVHILVAKFTCDKKETRFQDTQTRSNGYGIEVLDPQCFYFFVFMFNGNLVEITIFTL